MTLFLDLTTSLANTSRNGIANVEWNIARELEALGVRPQGFRLANGEVHRVPVAEVLASAVFASHREPGSDQHAPARSASARAARAGLSVLFGSDTRLSVQALTMLVRCVEVVRTIVPNRQVLSDDVLDERHLCADDVMLTVGAEWTGQLAERLGVLRARTGCHVVAVVYDLIPIDYPELAGSPDVEFFRRYFVALTRYCSQLLCISEYTKAALIRFAEAESLALPPVSVVRCGDELALGSPSAHPTNLARGRPFFLCVGTIEKRKNHQILTDAQRFLRDAGHHAPLIVFVGGAGWAVEDWLQELADSRTASRDVLFLGPVDNLTLADLYDSAEALLFPSIVEGWGLPVRDAATRGCPVIASDIPVMHEALEGYHDALFVNPYEPLAWAAALCSPPPRTGRPMASRSWTDAARDILTRCDVAPPDLNGAAT